MLEVNKENYEEEVLQSKGLVMVDVWGPKCQPCLALMPAVEELEKEYSGKLKVAKLNAAQNRLLCAKLRLMGLPAFLFYKDGTEVNRLAGQDLSRADLVKEIEKLIGE